MSKDFAIRVEGVSKRYKIGASKSDSIKDAVTSTTQKVFGRSKKSEDFWALNDVSFDVPKGKVLGIIGKNGAGKSTLLKVLSRITKPTSGRVELNGRVSSLLEVGTGFHPELTGRENIFLNATILGMSRNEVKQKFSEIVDFAGIGKFIDTPVKHYSSGMYVRLAFSVAANLEPEILMIDEVLAVGDADFQRKCLGKMSEVSQTHGRTVLFVSHNMGAVKDLCDEVIYLKNGSIEAIGSAQDMTAKYLEDNLTKFSDPKLEIPEEERMGNGKVRITNLQLISAETKTSVNSIITGDSMLIEFTYKAEKSEYLSGLDIRLNVVDSNKKSVSNLGMELWGGEIGELKQEGKIYCKLPKLPFTKGDYYIIANAVTNRELADKYTPTKFTVLDADFYGNGGRRPVAIPQGVYVEHEWFTD